MCNVGGSVKIIMINIPALVWHERPSLGTWFLIIMYL